MLGKQRCHCKLGLASGWLYKTVRNALATLRLRARASYSPLARPKACSSFFYHQLHGIDLFRCGPSAGARPGGARPVVAFFLSCSSSFKHVIQIFSPDHIASAQGKVAKLFPKGCSSKKDQRGRKSSSPRTGVAPSLPPPKNIPCKPPLADRRNATSIPVVKFLESWFARLHELQPSHNRPCGPGSPLSSQAAHQHQLLSAPNSGLVK